MFDDDIFAQMRKLFRDFPSFDDDVRDLFDAGDMKNGQPIVWGYHFTLGPDGIPHYSAYSNVDKIQKQLQSQFSTSSAKELPALEDHPTLNDMTEDGYRLAHYDTVQDENMLRVIVELPGVEKKDIDLTAKENFLTIATTHAVYKYKAEIPLKVTTMPKKIKASFKNGILELKLPIVKKETDDAGDKVSIE